jgi:hypothetical protein
MRDVLPSPPSKASTGYRWMACSLLALALQDLLLFAAGLLQVQPHPPHNVLPLIEGLMALAAWAAAACLNAAHSNTTERPHRWLGVAVCGVALLHLVNFGPHKFFQPQGPLIAPMVLVGLLMIGQTLASAWQVLRSAKAAS